MGFGKAVWSSPGWRAEVEEWIDARLDAAGIERTGPVEQERIRPWGLVLNAPTSSRLVWFKAPGLGTTFEVGLYEILARKAPDTVLTPIATDLERGWLLLPDGGTSLGARFSGEELTDAMIEGLVTYGQLQRRLQPTVAQMLEVGVADMSPSAMPDRFAEAVEAVVRAKAPGDESTDRLIAQVLELEPRYQQWCRQLQASPVEASLDHNDLHPWNMLGGGGEQTRFFDWGDSVVAHPFAAMLVPLGMFDRGMVGSGRESLERARDAYLEVFSDAAPRDELVETLAIACRVAKVARALTWERALLSARDLREEVDPDWAIGPVENFAALLEEGWVGSG